MRNSYLSRRAVLAGVLAAVLIPGVSQALTEEEQGVLGDISAKLAGMRTMNGEFVQFDPNQQQRQGKFFIARPGKVRFQYDPPATIQVIADGKSVLVFDKKLQTYDRRLRSGCCSIRVSTWRARTVFAASPSLPIWSRSSWRTRPASAPGR